MGNGTFHGRDHYEEYHEREFDPQLESRLEPGECEDEPEIPEEETNDCPLCKHNEACKGGCEAYVDCGFTFEKVGGAG